MKVNYTKTIHTCFIGYIVQAIVNNFIPLLFVTLQLHYQISLEKITLLVTINFGIQLLVDLIAAVFIDKIGYRVAAVAAHILAAIGLISLAILPGIFRDPYIGILLAVTLYAIGGGLLEVLISPIVEACPTDHKEKTMSMLHSFYCWGHVGVVCISTVFFAVFGIDNWKFLALFWALIPIYNVFMFLKVPIAPLIKEGTEGLSFGKLIRNKVFWILLLFMLCAGASEQAVSQWASAFAEKGLGVSKTIGDIAGPMTFAIMMGISRTIYGKYGERINLKKYMVFSGGLCIFSYLVISLSANPLFGLIGCAIAGFSVGAFWPGTFSMAASNVRGGGTAMFAFLALAGDLGCSAGPTVVGMASSLYDNNLKIGILTAIVFPVIFLIGLVLKKTPGIQDATTM